MSSVGEDFPKQQERVRHLKELYIDLPDGVGAFGAAHIEQVLQRATVAQSSGDVIQVLRSYQELVDCKE